MLCAKYNIFYLYQGMWHGDKINKSKTLNCWFQAGEIGSNLAHF